jgi:hypothetical protein
VSAAIASPLLSYLLPRFPSLPHHCQFSTPTRLQAPNPSRKPPPPMLARREINYRPRAATTEGVEGIREGETLYPQFLTSPRPLTNHLRMPSASAEQPLYRRKANPAKYAGKVLPAYPRHFPDPILFSTSILLPSSS